ncbi:transmembrane channel-like protein 8 [Ctenodactylus gundi]
MPPTVPTTPSTCQFSLPERPAASGASRGRPSRPRPAGYPVGAPEGSRSGLDSDGAEPPQQGDPARDKAAAAISHAPGGAGLARPALTAGSAGRPSQGGRRPRGPGAGQRPGERGEGSRAPAHEAPRSCDRLPGRGPAPPSAVDGCALCSQLCPLCPLPELLAGWLTICLREISLSPALVICAPGPRGTAYSFRCLSRTASGLPVRQGIRALPPQVSLNAVRRQSPGSMRQRESARPEPWEPEPWEPEPWEPELAWAEGLGASRTPLRALPYAMQDKRCIRQLREPVGARTTRGQRWRRRRQAAERRLREGARRLAGGFGLWRGALYEIGGLFGSGIRSYFTFLRFLLLLNLLTSLLTAGFVLLPLAWLRPPPPPPALNLTLQCHSSPPPQAGIARLHNQLWNVLTGRAFNNTYLFYGAYRAGPESDAAYSIRLAYLLCPLACLLLCFCGTLRRMVKGLPQRPGLGQDYGVPLSTKIFSSWDFCIHVREAAAIKNHEISNELKVHLEERRRLQLDFQRTPAQRAWRILSYVRVNVLIGLLVAGAISAIFWATKYSQDNKEESLFLVLQYLPPGVISLVNFLGPLLFTFLIQLENYPPSTEVNLILLWCVALKLASLGMFSFSLGQTVLCLGRNHTSCDAYGYNACDYQCWETSVGVELYKLIIFNFLLTVAFAFLVTLPRRLLVERLTHRFWTWLGREEFLVPKNVLDIVAGQTVTWMALFYCPLLPLFNSIFLFLTFYIKKYTLLRNCRASPRLFRASSSTFFFQLVLLLGLLLAAGPLVYVVSSTHSSWNCGLFTNYSAPWEVVPELVALRLPPWGQRALHYLSSHAFGFPLLVCLSLVLTACVSQSQANAQALQGLRKQLVCQVKEKWRLVEKLSRLLPELDPGESPGPASPRSRGVGSFGSRFPSSDSSGPGTPWPAPSGADPTRLSSSDPGSLDVPDSGFRFRFPSST